jgi:phytoene dehydrogenase-like protein
LCSHFCIFFCFCLSGLAAAYKLKSNGVKVTVFEAEGRAGGKLRSVSHHDLVWDEGANTMVTIYLSKFFFSIFRVNLCFLLCESQVRVIGKKISWGREFILASCMDSFLINIC